MALGGINPENCTTFIQIRVDVNDLTDGQITGGYAVDNMIGNGSTNEGTNELNTVVATNTDVCWQVLPIDPQYAGDFTITEIDAPNGWASQPAQYGKTADLWTGQVSKSSTGGSVVQGVTANFNSGSLSWTGTLPIKISLS
ncbi:conserved hypothetical protein [Tenacibaculum sp. 190524A02b]|uniref:Uncharacterized protein n=1 Tax=Tenacibaculum vairaonense TaxID=3137860 RepID=A0ABM9PS08_9FLAO